MTAVRRRVRVGTVEGTLTTVTKLYRRDCRRWLRKELRMEGDKNTTACRLRQAEACLDGQRMCCVR